MMMTNSGPAASSGRIRRRPRHRVEFKRILLIEAGHGAAEIRTLRHDASQVSIAGQDRIIATGMFEVLPLYYYGSQHLVRPKSKVLKTIPWIFISRPGGC